MNVQKAECVRLRVEEKLSYSEILKRVDVSKGSLSLWLRDFPLNEQQLKSKRSVVQSKERNEIPDSRIASLIKSELTRKEKGHIAEAAALFRFALMGLTPLKAVFDGEVVDCYVEMPDRKIIRAQVKWLHHNKKGAATARLQTSGLTGIVRSYTPEDFDVLIGFDVAANACHVWNWEQIGTNKSSIAISNESFEAWQRLTCR